jgi:hypothetical protein
VCRAEALARHTYRLRMERLLREVEQALPVPAVIVGPGAAAPVERQGQQEPEPPSAENPQTKAQAPALPTLEGRLADFLSLVPEQARRLLVVGQGIGGLAQALQDRPAAEVVVMDTEELEAFLPHLALDHGLVQQLERDRLPPFDAVLLVDVLEPLLDARQPGTARRAERWSGTTRRACCRHRPRLPTCHERGLPSATVTAGHGP